MPTDTSTSQETIGDTATELGSGKIAVSRPTYQFLPVEKPHGGRPSMFESIRIMALLESAYKIGATHEEAALHAGLPNINGLKYHIQNKTVLRITLNGEDTGERITFPELVDIWKGNLTLAAKSKIYNAVAAKDTGTQDSWRVLERKQKDWALQKGQSGVDGGGATNVEIDLLGEARARVEKFAKDPAEVIPPPVEPSHS